MEHSSVFLKLRAVAYSITTFVCFVWIILLSCLAFTRWSMYSLSERSFLALFLVINTITVIVLPILILQKFRTWLDGARLLFLLICHIGIAMAFAIWNPTFSCPDQTPDGENVCQLLNIFILLASWVPPALLITYGVCLAVYTFRYASRPQLDKSSDVDSNDEEAIKFRQGSLQMMGPDGPLVSSREVSPVLEDRGSHNSQHYSRRPSQADTLVMPASQPLQDGQGSDDKESRKSRHTSGRLSKRSPAWYF